MANISILSQAHVSELSLHNPRHSTTKYSWVYVPLSENRHIFSYIRSPWFLCPIMFFCKFEVHSVTGQNMQTHPHGSSWSREWAGRAEDFWKQHQFFLLPWPPAAGGMVLNSKNRELVQSETSQSNGVLQLCSEEGQRAIFFYIGPDPTSTEHKSQFWSKRTPGNKAIFMPEHLVFLFCFFYFFSNSWFSLSRILGGSGMAKLGIVL